MNKWKRHIQYKIAVKTICIIVIASFLCQNITWAGPSNLATKSLFKLIQRHDSSSDSITLADKSLKVGALDNFLTNPKIRRKLFEQAQPPDSLNMSGELAQYLGDFFQEIEVLDLYDDIFTIQVKLDGKTSMLYLFKDNLTEQQIEKTLNIHGRDLQLAHKRKYWFEVIEPKWEKVKEGKKRDDVHFIGEILNPTLNEGYHWIVQRVSYKGKKYIAKFSDIDNVIDGYIIPQARICKYLKKRGLSGVNRAEHFLQLQDGRKLILFEDYDSTEKTGATLADYIEESTRISEGEALDIILKVSKKIRELRKVGVYHWDIKPLNVWITYDGKVEIFDFDFSFMTNKEFKQRHLQSQMTPYYASKYRLKDQTYPRDRSIDRHMLDEIYSIGKTLTNMLIGTAFDELYASLRAPLAYRNDMLYERIKNGTYSISERVTRILEEVICDGESDYKTIDEFIQAIEDEIACQRYETEPFEEPKDILKEDFTLQQRVQAEESIGKWTYKSFLGKLDKRLFPVFKEGSYLSQIILFLTYFCLDFGLILPLFGSLSIVALNLHIPLPFYLSFGFLKWAVLILLAHYYASRAFRHIHADNYPGPRADMISLVYKFFYMINRGLKHILPNWEHIIPLSTDILLIAIIGSFGFILSSSLLTLSAILIGVFVIFNILFYIYDAKKFNSKIIGPEWNKGVEIVDETPYKGGQMQFIGEDLGASTIVGEVIYKASDQEKPEVYMVKLDKENSTDCFVDSQAKVHNDMNKGGIKGISQTEHFIKLKDGRSAILFKKFPPGKTLEEKIIDEGGLQLEEALDIILKVSKTLESIHNAGYIHCDIKPENIYIADTGKVILFDFDTSFKINSKFREKQRNLFSKGSFFYMSLNRVKLNTYGLFEKRYLPGFSEDVYSLGITLIHMMLGAEDFKMLFETNQEEDLITVISGLLSNNTVAERMNKSDKIPEWLKPILFKAIYKGRSRYKTIGEFIKALEKARKEEGEDAHHFEAFELKQPGNPVNVPKEIKDRKRDTKKTFIEPGKYEFEMTETELKDLTAALSIEEDELADFIRKAYSILEDWAKEEDSIDLDLFKNKKVLIAMLKRNASKYLFEDCKNNNFIGINETIYDIARIDQTFARILFVAGLAHELRHEAGMREEALSLDTELMLELVKDKDLLGSQTSQDIVTLVSFIEELGRYCVINDFRSAIVETAINTSMCISDNFRKRIMDQKLAIIFSERKDIRLSKTVAQDLLQYFQEEPIENIEELGMVLTRCLIQYPELIDTTIDILVRTEDIKKKTLLVYIINGTLEDNKDLILTAKHVKGIVDILINVNDYHATLAISQLLTNALQKKGNIKLSRQQIRQLMAALERCPDFLTGTPITEALINNPQLLDTVFTVFEKLTGDPTRRIYAKVLQRAIKGNKELTLNTDQINKIIQLMTDTNIYEIWLELDKLLASYFRHHRDVVLSQEQSFDLLMTLQTIDEAEMDLSSLEWILQNSPGCLKAIATVIEDDSLTENKYTLIASTLCSALFKKITLISDVVEFAEQEDTPKTNRFFISVIEQFFKELIEGYLSDLWDDPIVLCSDILHETRHPIVRKIFAQVLSETLPAEVGVDYETLLQTLETAQERNIQNILALFFPCMMSCLAVERDVSKKQQLAGVFTEGLRHPEKITEICNRLRAEHIEYIDSLETKELDKDIQYSSRVLGKLTALLLQSGKKLPDELKKAFKLLRIGLKDAGNSVANYHHISENCLTMLSPIELEEPPADPPVYKQKETCEVPVMEDDYLHSILEGATLYKKLGRTLIFEKEGRFIALKFLKQSRRLKTDGKIEEAVENPGKLAFESEYFDYLNELKERAILTGNYPGSMLLGKDSERVTRIRYDTVSPEVREALPDFDRNSYGNRAYIDNDGCYTVMAYTTDSPEYFTYIHEEENPDKVQKAMERNIHDLFTLARFGVIHPDLIELFHSPLLQSRKDDGLYIWMIDIIRPFVTSYVKQYGAGMIRSWENTVEYPNMRLSGIADFAEMVPIDNLVDLTHEHSSYMRSNLDRFPDGHRRKFILAHFMGNYLLALILDEARRLKAIDENRAPEEDRVLDWEKPEALAEWIKDIYSMAYRTFTGEEDIDITELVNWEMLAKQMAFFVSGEYKNYADKEIPEEIFDSKGVYIRTGDGWGYINRTMIVDILKNDPNIPNEMIDSIINKYFGKAHSSKGRKFPKGILAFKLKYQSLIDSEPDMNVRRIIECLHDDYSTGWRVDGIHEDLGPLNGPMLIQELIKANYIYTMAMLGRKIGKQYTNNGGTNRLGFVEEVLSSI